MSVYTAFCSRLLFPLHERIKGHQSAAVKRRLETSQWHSTEEIERRRVERLRAFLIDIGKHVPYYKDLFAKSDFDPTKVEAITALQALPFLTKAIIRHHTDALKADDHGPLSRYNTGGSSGEPLVFYIGKARSSHDVAAKWRATRWWGVDIGDPEMVIWGSPIELGAQDRLRRLRDGLMRSHLLPAFDMSASNLDGFVDAIRSVRPKMLFGYPSALAHIARHAQARGVDMTGLGIKVAFVTSERLYDDQREVIGRLFGCPVANGYGSRDAGFIAHECPEGGMHVMAEDIVVELVDSQDRVVANGQPGEIVVTHLGTRDFPFLRYRSGDIAVMDSQACACGRGLPLLKEIQGRSTDFVLASDGTVMHGLSLIYVLRDLPGIQSFKIIQETAQHTRVLLVTNQAFTRETRELIDSGFRRRLGADVRVELQLVEDIPPAASGKYRYVVSHAMAQRPEVAHA